jgi:hypothetical protein
MAKYMLLIWGDQDAWANADEAERERIEAGHRRFNAAAGPAVLLGHELAPATTATSVAATDAGRAEVTDGPFLETKEVVDSALRLAALLPETAANYRSGVEIRPVV